jgi:hypothetical protein
MPDGIFWPYIKQILDNYCEALQLVIDRYKPITEDSGSQLERHEAREKFNELSQNIWGIISGCTEEIKETTAIILQTEGKAVSREASKKIKRRIRRRIKKKSHFWKELRYFGSKYNKTIIGRFDEDSLLDLRIPPSESEILYRALNKWIQSEIPRRYLNDINAIFEVLWVSESRLTNAEKRRELIRNWVKGFANNAVYFIIYMILIAILVLMVFWDRGYLH